MRHTMIYVAESVVIHVKMRLRTHSLLLDLYWTRLDFRQSFQGSWHLYRGRPSKLPRKEFTGGKVKVAFLIWLGMYY